MINSEDLFSRRKNCFASSEEILDFLKSNSFPVVRGELSTSQVLEKANKNKFCKDDYMYLLRGTTANQESGFYSYLYSQKGITTKQFGQINSKLTPEVLSIYQNLYGKSSFISLTTDILTAGIFGDKYYSNSDGRIYVVKVPLKDIYRINYNAKLKGNIFKDVPLYLSDEVEFLVPDFILPDEILASFNIYDFMGVYKYLARDIGLSISEEDLGIKEQWKTNPLYFMMEIAGGANSQKDEGVNEEVFAKMILRFSHNINIEKEIESIPNKVTKRIEPSFDYETVIKRMKEKGTLEILLHELRDLENREYLFVSSSHLIDHNLKHTKRDMFLVTAIATELGLSRQEIRILLAMAKYHDIGRTDDFEDKEHGKRSVLKLTSELNEFSLHDQKLIKFGIENHCLSRNENLRTLSEIKDENKRKKYEKMLFVFKDADRADRVRLGDLDESRLEYSVSKKMVGVAKTLLVKFESFERTYLSSRSVIELPGKVEPVKKEPKARKSIITAKKLFSRREECIQSPDKDQMCADVKEFLKKSGYPTERSKNLQFKEMKLRNPNKNLCKDGYIYLLRGTTSGQETGFYSYPYSARKMTINEICEEDPYFTPDNLAKLQNDVGRSCFISLTTNVFGAGAFSLKKNFKPGKIYVVKIPLEDAYMLESPFGMEEFEYMVPDFVLPDEIMASFEYYDAKGVYNYLRSQGLHISLEDLDLPQGSFSDEQYYKKSVETQAGKLQKFSDLHKSDNKGIKFLTGIDIDRLIDG